MRNPHKSVLHWSTLFALNIERSVLAIAFLALLYNQAALRYPLSDEVIDTWSCGVFIACRIETRGLNNSANIGTSEAPPERINWLQMSAANHAYRTHCIVWIVIDTSYSR